MPDPHHHTPSCQPPQHQTRRRFVQTGLGAGLSTAGLLSLSGCEDIADRLARAVEDDPAAFAPAPGEAVSPERHLLNRVAFGPSPRDEARLHELGPEAWLERQLDPASIPDRGVAVRTFMIESLRLPAAELYNMTPRRLLYDITRNKILRAVYSERQLYERVVDHWTDQFNIVAFKDHCRWLKPAEDRDVIRAHAMGRFRELVRASATSGAMLIYLDGHDNKVEEDGDKPNENYARELLELHCMGVSSGYTQQDIFEAARCLSGWTYTNRPFSGAGARVAFDPARHDNGQKEVLGVVIPAGGGADDLERLLDIVVNHPATARYQAQRLCRRFIHDDPPEAAIGEVAAAFTQSGGDITAALRALFKTPAFNDPAARGALFRRPFGFIAATLRATDASTDGREAVMDALERMGHAPFQYPTPDGYPMEAAPWHGTLLHRWNFAAGLAAGTLGGCAIDPAFIDDAGRDPLAAVAGLWGRTPTDAEAPLLTDLPPREAIGLALAAPAFMCC